MLCRLLAMDQTAFADGQLLDLSPSLDDGVMMPEVDVGWGEVAEALVVAPVVVSIDEGADLRFQVSGQVVVLQQDAILQGLVSALDLALCLGMVRCAAQVADTPVLEPGRKIAGNVGRAVVAEQSRFVNDPSPVSS